MEKKNKQRDGACVNEVMWCIFVVFLRLLREEREKREEVWTHDQRFISFLSPINRFLNTKSKKNEEEKEKKKKESYIIMFD